MFKPKPVTDPTSPFHMPGTEHTGQFIVPATSSLGRVGFRVLFDNLVRVRVEPKDSAAAEKLGEVLTTADGWKQPDGGQHRFSQVFTDGDAVIKIVEQLIVLLGKQDRVRNYKAWTWRSLLKGLKAKQSVGYNPFHDSHVIDDGYGYPEGD